MIRTLWNDLLNLFYPRLCLLCEQPLIDQVPHICLHCLCDLPYILYNKYPDNSVRKLYAGIPQIRETAAFLHYEKGGYVQTLIHDLKYHDNYELAEYLGRMAGHGMKKDGLFSDIDYVAPTPLHPKKERQRGYNQTYWIARGIAAIYCRPVNNEVLYRKVYTKSQTRKSRYERHLNIENVFDVKETHIFEGKHILLIDDVITTGATTIACIKALTTIPNIRISVFSLSTIWTG
jgi:ComF family protein